MRKHLITTILTVLVIAGFSTPVMAGGINGPESSVIAAASGTFTYEGAEYVADSWCISALYSKFSEDGVDLTETQASSLISLGYSNIARGVAEGYLIPTGAGTQDDSAQETEPQQDDLITEIENVSDADDSASDAAQASGSGISILQKITAVARTAITAEQYSKALQSFLIENTEVWNAGLHALIYLAAVLIN